MEKETLIKGETGSRIETYDDNLEEVGLLQSKETHCCRMRCHRHCRGRCRCRVCCRRCRCRVRCVAVVVSAGALSLSSLLQVSCRFRRSCWRVSCRVRRRYRVLQSAGACVLSERDKYKR